MLSADAMPWGETKYYVVNVVVVAVVFVVVVVVVESFGMSNRYLFK